MNNGNQVSTAIIVIFIAVFVMLAAVQSPKKFVLDEIDFPAVAHTTSQTGTPVYYRGEANPRHIGTYHPTLYIHSLALFIKAFGYSETTVRLFGAVCVLLSSWIVVLISGLWWGNDPKRRKRFVFIFLAVFLLHPYTLANAMLPDIDSTVLPVTMLLFIYASLVAARGNNEDGRWDTKAFLCLGALFALNLWAKLTVTLILPVWLFMLLLSYRRSVVRSFLFCAAVSAVGALAFTATYWAYCKALALPFGYTFSFLLASFSKGTSGGSRLAGMWYNVHNSLNFLRWLTPYFIALSMAAVIGVGNRSLRERNVVTQEILSLALLGIFVTCFYLPMISPFGGFYKYPFVIFTLLILPIAYWGGELIACERPRIALALIAGIFVVGSIYAFMFGDVVFRDAQGTFTSNILTAAVLACLVAIPLVLFPAHGATRALLVVALVLCTGIQLGISRAQAVAPYPTRYHYGKTGFEETINYLTNRIEPGEAVCAMKDIGYYANNCYLENSAYLYGLSDQKRLEAVLKERKARYYIVSKGIGEDNIDALPVWKTLLDTYCTVDRSFGNHIVYVLK